MRHARRWTRQRPATPPWRPQRGGGGAAARRSCCSGCGAAVGAEAAAAAAAARARHRGSGGGALMQLVRVRGAGFHSTCGRHSCRYARAQHRNTCERAARLRHSRARLPGLHHAWLGTSLALPLPRLWRPRPYPCLGKPLEAHSHWRERRCAESLMRREGGLVECGRGVLGGYPGTRQAAPLCTKAAAAQAAAACFPARRSALKLHGAPTARSLLCH
jgi:hypothetical protein